MSAYYDGKRLCYLVDGVEFYMTEEAAEEYQTKNPTKDVQADFQREAPLPDEAADDYLECSCPDETPNSNMTTTLCNSCRAYFASLED